MRTPKDSAAEIAQGLSQAVVAVIGTCAEQLEEGRVDLRRLQPLVPLRELGALAS